MIINRIKDEKVRVLLGIVLLDRLVNFFGVLLLVVSVYREWLVEKMVELVVDMVVVKIMKFKMVVVDVILILVKI